MDLFARSMSMPMLELLDPFLSSETKLLLSIP